MGGFKAVDLDGSYAEKADLLHRVERRVLGDMRYHGLLRTYCPECRQGGNLVFLGKGWRSGLDKSLIGEDCGYWSIDDDGRGSTGR